MLVGLTGIAACGDTGVREVSSTDPSAGLASSAAVQAPQQVASPTLVYFEKNENIGTAGRPGVPATLEGAIAALLQGPDDFETDIGMATAIPEATTLLGVSVSGGTAVVDLSEAFQSGGGSLSMQLRVAQVVFTATQFDEVQRVTIKLDGQDVDAIGGEGVPAVDLDRTDFTNVTPAVLVESPTRGHRWHRPEGLGNRQHVRAVVSYDRHGDGLIVDEGVTNASAGTGAGRLRVHLDLRGPQAGIGEVIATRKLEGRQPDRRLLGTGSVWGVHPIDPQTPSTPSPRLREKNPSLWRRRCRRSSPAEAHFPAQAGARGKVRSSDRPGAPMNEADLTHLRRCVDLAAEAVEHGDQPFGSVLVSGDGTVLAERRNRIVTTGDLTAHPELALAGWASQHLDPSERAAATMYTSGGTARCAPPPRASGDRTAGLCAVGADDRRAGRPDVKSGCG
jgi:hypothetical protein